MEGNSGRGPFNSRPFLIFTLALLISTGLIIGSNLALNLTPHERSSHTTRSPPIAQVYSGGSYDEQVAITFGDNFQNLAFNVTAVPQVDSSTGVGPANLLNGLTDRSYWYQVGLSYRWPLPNGTASGFNMAYEVFEPCPSQYPDCNGCHGSVLPANCTIGLDNLKVNPGDLVQLSLRLLANTVEMQAVDWNTSSRNSETFSSYGASQFLGLNSPADSHGFFTGLMTEQYFSAPYYGTGQPVIYRQASLNISSGVMWMEEFNPNTFPPLFQDQTPSSVSFSNSTLLHYFSSNGTAEAANSHEFVTGLTPVIFPSIIIPTQALGSPGRQSSIELQIQDPSGLIVGITSVKVSSGFGVYNNTSLAPPNFGGSSTFTTTITIPSSIAVGNYTVSVVVKLEVRYPQVPDWIETQPISAESTIAVTKSSPAPQGTPPPTGPPVIPPLPGQTPMSNPSTGFDPSRLFHAIFVPSLLAEAILAIAALAVILRRRSRSPKLPALLPILCLSCGGHVTDLMIYCPWCGITLVPSAPPSRLRGWE